MTVVVKIGGAAGVNAAAICADVARLAHQGERLVLVHGGSDEANRLGERLDHPPRFVTSPSGFTSRYTDRETLEIFAMATAGRLNTLLVEALQAAGVNALGLTGASGRLLVARHKDTIRAVEDGRVRVLRGDHTGTIEQVNAALLALLLDAGYTPVVAPLALSPAGVLLNVDADRAAAAIAGALRADCLLLLTNVPGLLRAFPDEASRVAQVGRDGLEEALAWAQGRMKKKVLGAREALERGAGRVVLASGRVESPVERALAGDGTVFV
jgi:acetylglutamate/LysW-gamma-L-alpha-aminoadipate kinase